MASVQLQGMVLSATNVGEFDKRLVILTREEGRITAFAKGARRPNNALVAACSPFNFGVFELYPGRNSYHLIKADIKNYFSGIPTDFDKVCLGSYFLEMADYLSVEGVDERARLGLLYQTLKALDSGKFSGNLLRDIYELKSYVIAGEYPNVFSCQCCHTKEKLVNFSMRLQGALCDKCSKTEGGAEISQSCLYAMQFIIATPVEKLFTFKLDEATEDELTRLLRSYRLNYHNHKYKSEEFLDLP